MLIGPLFIAILVVVVAIVIFYFLPPTIDPTSMLRAD